MVYEKMPSTLKLSVKKEDRSELHHPETLLSKISSLCMSEQFSDVTFEVEGEKISGHVLILAARSEYFRALLFGGFAESNQKAVRLPKVPIEAFKVVLTFIYTGHLSLSKLNEEILFDALCLANQYGLTELYAGISEYFLQILSLDNVCGILNAAELHGIQKLESLSHNFLDTNANKIINHGSFKNLSEESLKKMLLRDTFCAPEFQIFIALRKWCKHNRNVAIQSVASLIRLPLMSYKQLSKVKRFYEIFDHTNFLQAVNEKIRSTSLKYRIRSLQEENIATENFGTRLTQGSDLYGGFAQHVITADNDLGIIVKLGSLTIINHLRLLLNSYCSYYVEVSVNKTEWDRVVDHQLYHCRSWQFLYFPSRAVQYIKLVGTYDSYNFFRNPPRFEVFSFEAYYTAEIPRMINGIVAPAKNLSTIKKAYEFHRYYFKLTKLEDSHLSKNTYHLVSQEDSFTVHLCQPYMIGSMRLLLLDINANERSFTIKTSMNDEDWEVVENRYCNGNSWQNLEFKPRVMVYIKIVRYLEENECFNALFECQSQILETTNDEPQAV